MTEVERECIRRIAECKAMSPEGITLERSLDSLALDSLDRVTLSFDLEEEYGIQIPEVELHQIQSVRGVVEAVERARVRKEAALAGSAGGS